jgi:hypothetical protein
MLDSILVVIVQHLDQVDVLSSSVFPMKLANLGVVMKQVETALAAPTALGTDLADAIGRDHNFVDLLFSEGLAAVIDIVELTATIY